jgi:hypothetical protein
LQQLKLKERQLLAVRTIIRSWKSWRRYKHSLAFDILFERLLLGVKALRETEENHFQQRIQQRREAELRASERLKDLREEYLDALRKVQRNEFVLPLFPLSDKEAGAGGGGGSKAFISSDELFQWCDPQLEIFNSVFNRQRYRQWTDRFKIRPPPSAITQPNPGVT